MPASGTVCDHIIEEGFYAPVRVFSREEARQFLNAARDPSEHPPLDWIKGHACTSRTFYEIATKPAIVDVVTAVLGNDVLLWGASLTSHPKGTSHPWHCDIETAASGRSLSVWIGLDSTEVDSSMALIPYSHRSGISVQEYRYRYDKQRDETTEDDIVKWAGQFDARCRVFRPEIHVGEALFFDGKLWHGTRNFTERTRWTLLLQYATPPTTIRIPDPNHLDWPFQFIRLPKPACILISGSDEAGVNRLVPPPPGRRNGWTPQLTSRVHNLQIPLPADDKNGWKAYPLFHGSTPDLQFLSCHVSVLTHGQSPHPPHTHDDEEILMLLSGEADLLLPNLPNASSTQEIPRKRLKAGELVYYPHDFPHTLETVSAEPANYLMLKWTNDPVETSVPLQHTHSCVFDSPGAVVPNGFLPRLIFEGATRRVQKLHCHASTLSPGAGYDAHVDAHDVVIVVLEGEIETLGERVGRHAVIFYPSGEPHGIRNPGQVAAKYVVFEFHARTRSRQMAVSNRTPSPQASNRLFVSKLIDPQCYVRTYKTVAWNLKQMRKNSKRP